MTSKTDIQNVIQAWVTAATGLVNMAWAKQPNDTQSDAPRPPKPYAAMHLMSRKFLGMRDEMIMPAPESPSILMTQRGQRELVLNCMVIGSDAEDRLEELVASISDPVTLEDHFHRKQEMVIQVVGGISDDYDFSLAGVPFYIDGTGLAPEVIAEAFVTLIEDNEAWLPTLEIDYTPGESSFELLGPEGYSFHYEFPAASVVLSEIIEAVDLSPLRTTDVMDLSEALETGWDEIATVDIFIHLETKIWRNPGVIEKVEGEIQGRTFSIGG